MNPSTKKAIILTGGVIVNAVGGNLINWGSILPYVASYYYHIDHSARSSDFSLIPFIGFMAESFIALIISYLCKYLSIFTILLISSTAYCAGMFFSSFILNPMLFSWIYGLCLGLLSGSICLPSLWMIWNEIPNNRASTSGILLTGYNLGSVPFSIAFTMIVNPNNIKAEKVSDNDRMFPKEVADRVPMTLRWITLSYIVCMYIGLVLLPRKGKINQEKSQKNLKFTQIIKNKRCWMLFLMMFLCLACQAYAQILYRVVALRYINDDHYSVYVGTAAYICSGMGRGIFGYLFDLYYWKKVMCIVYFFETVLMSGMWFTLRDKALYAFFMVFFHFLTSSFYNNVLLLTDKAFPGDKVVISYICFAFIPAYFTPYFLEKLVEPIIGLGGILGLLAGFMATMFVLVILYKDPENDKVFLVEKDNEFNS